MECIYRNEGITPQSPDMVCKTNIEGIQKKQKHQKTNLANVLRMGKSEKY